MLMLSLLLALSAHADDTAANKVMPAPAPAIPGGLDKSVIDQKIKENLDKIRGCYENNAKEGGAKGRVSTRFTIGGDGKVTKAVIQDSQLKNEKVETCLTNELKAIVFPAPAGGGTVEVDYPFMFSPEAKAAHAKKKAKK